MAGLRHAIAWASIGQYLTIVISFGSVLVMARLITPTEFGVSLIGGAILAIAEAIREVAGGAYLIREEELDDAKVRTITTMNALVTIAVSATILLSAEPLAHVLGMPSLAMYLGIAALGYLLGPLYVPQLAIFSRQLAMARLAIVNVLLALVGTSAAIVLALLDFEAMSFAWAGVATAVTAATVSLATGGSLSIYRPSLSHWRSVISFGGMSSASAILGKLSEALPVLILSKMLSVEAAAIGQRSVVLSLVPERIVLAAVWPVALPEFSRRVRAGEDLGAAYLLALSYMSVVQWPAMLLLAILASPVVQLVLGSQWLDVTPLLRILCPALMLTVPMGIQYAVLVSVGAVRTLPRLLFLQMLVMTSSLTIGAQFGLHAAAWSMYVAIPIVAALSIISVRAAIKFRWLDLWILIGRSIFVTAMMVVAPLVLTLTLYPSWTQPMGAAVAMAALGCGGWLVGLYLSRHPFRNEIRRAASAMRRLLAGLQHRANR